MKIQLKCYSINGRRALLFFFFFFLHFDRLLVHSCCFHFNAMIDGLAEHQTRNKTSDEEKSKIKSKRPSQTEPNQTKANQKAKTPRWIPSLTPTPKSRKCGLAVCRTPHSDALFKKKHFLFISRFSIFFSFFFLLFLFLFLFLVRRRRRHRRFSNRAMRIVFSAAAAALASSRQLRSLCSFWIKNHFYFASVRCRAVQHNDDDEDQER